MSSAAATPTKATINHSFSITVTTGAPPAVDGIADTGVAPPVMLIALVVMLTPELLVELKVPAPALEVAYVKPAPEVIVYAELAN